jgi:hypothetical protein
MREDREIGFGNLGRAMPLPILVIQPYWNDSVFDPDFGFALRQQSAMPPKRFVAQIELDLPNLSRFRS